MSHIRFRHDSDVYIINEYQCCGCRLVKKGGFDGPAEYDRARIFDHLKDHLRAAQMVPEKAWRSIGEDAQLTEEAIEKLLAEAAAIREEMRSARERGTWTDPTVGSGRDIARERVRFDDGPGPRTFVPLEDFFEDES